MPGKPADAERFSGYKTGGIRPFGQTRKISAVIEKHALAKDLVYVNGGQRGAGSIASAGLGLGTHMASWRNIELCRAPPPSREPRPLAEVSFSRRCRSACHPPQCQKILGINRCMLASNRGEACMTNGISKGRAKGGYARAACLSQDQGSAIASEAAKNDGGPTASPMSPACWKASGASSISPA